MSETNIPTIEVFKAIAPANSALGEHVLVYTDLAPSIKKYRSTFPERAARVWEAEPGSLEEIGNARQLAFEYLLRDAEEVVESQNPDSRSLWADRFTEASIELYGQPDHDEVARLITDEHDLLTSLRGVPGVSQKHVNFLLGVYQPTLGDRNPDVAEAVNARAEREKRAVEEYGKPILDKYGPLFDLVDQAGKEKFMPRDLKKLFEEAIEWSAENDDPEWAKWNVEYFDRANVSTSAQRRLFLIGRHRSAATKRKSKGLIGHEFLVHGLRAKNGYKTNDSKLATGLPDYLTTEEGLGVLTDQAVTGSMPEGAQDFYIDIALALGTLDGTQRTRHEIFDICFARRVIRAQLKNEDLDKESIAGNTWSHVDRIYRGGPGDDMQARQAIFTKDISYYVGYQKMAAYIADELDRGKSAKEIFEYLSLGSFDPTDPAHAERAKKARAATKHTA